MVVVALCGSGGEEETSVNAKRLCSSCSEERPALPRSILEVEYPKRHRNKEMGNTDNIKEKFEIAEAMASQLEKALKEIKEVKRPLQEADVAPVPDCEVDCLLKEKRLL